LKHLAEKDLVNYAPYDVVTPTSAGKKVDLSAANPDHVHVMPG